MAKHWDSFLSDCRYSSSLLISHGNSYILSPATLTGKDGALALLWYDHNHIFLTSFIIFCASLFGIRLIHMTVGYGSWWISRQPSLGTSSQLLRQMLMGYIIHSIQNSYHSHHKRRCHAYHQYLIMNGCQWSNRLKSQLLYTQSLHHGSWIPFQQWHVVSMYHNSFFFLSTSEHIIYCMKTMYSKLIRTNNMAADVLRLLSSAKHECFSLMLGMEAML